MPAKPRAAILISGNGSNLQAIIDAVAEQRLDMDIALVVSNQEHANGLKRAQQAGITTRVIAHHGESRDEYDHRLLQCLQQANVELVVLAGFLRILSDAFVTHYLGRMINIHPSLLPRHKGLNTHRRVLQAGDETHGATVHFVVPELDAGPIILQASLHVAETESEQQLAERVLALEHQIYPMALQWVVSGMVRLVDGKLIKSREDLPVLLQY